MTFIFKTWKSTVLGIAALIAPTFGVQAATETYAIDPGHSSVEFSIRHFFSKVTGRFQKFEGNIVVDREALEKSEVKATIEAKSVDTNQEKRDIHLRSKDFFEVEKFPKMTFQSQAWKRIADNEYEVSGDLTLHGITKPVVLKVKNLGFGEGMSKTPISGWEVHTQIKRSDFGINSGIPAVGDEVDIEINVEADRK